MAYQIKYALGGGFGGTSNCDWEDCDAKTEEEAMEYAYEMACQVYESYEGSSGVRTVEDIMEEDELEEAYALEEWVQERESWLDYTVREVS